VPDPNPYPASTAKSETFIGFGSTVVIPVPTATTSITIGSVVVTLASGGTPVHSIVPTEITQPNAVTPSWSKSLLMSLFCGNY
jgi:chitinase